MKDIAPGGFSRVIRVAMAGNPNTGKTSLFNAITGMRQKVANYAGVSIAKAEANVHHQSRVLSIIDLPGIYSLSAHAADEAITWNYILDERPDVLVCVIDSCNLGRGLGLCLQLFELGRPVVVALNMVDEAAKAGIDIDTNGLSLCLGVPVIATVGTKGAGKERLLAAIIEAASQDVMLRKCQYSKDIEEAIALIHSAVDAWAVDDLARPHRWLSLQLLEGNHSEWQRMKMLGGSAPILEIAKKTRLKIEALHSKNIELALAQERYNYIAQALPLFEKASATADHLEKRKKLTADDILLHPVFGLPIFLLLMWAVFKVTFLVGALPAQIIREGIGWLSATAAPLIPIDLVRSLIIDCILGGVGTVISFLPLIVMLTVCLSILEDSGYMSRAAFLTDRWLSIFGLHGRTFFPLILGFGCSVPAIMATRSLQNKSDRIIVCCILPLLSCGAKLPVYVILAAAFFPHNADTMVFVIYLTGAVIAFLASLVMKSLLFKDKPSFFAMELPPYRMPSAKVVVSQAAQSALTFVRRVSTIILVVSIAIWAATNFPRPAVTDGSRNGSSTVTAESMAAQHKDILEHSFAGRFGHFIEPVIAPLGFDWKIGVAAFSGMAAKELTVSTLAILNGSGSNSNTGELAAHLKENSGLSGAAAFALMLFTLLLPPCIAALSTIRSELGNRWLAFTVTYLCIVAWVISWAGYSIGKLIGI